jgi:hypothetical protein
MKVEVRFPISDRAVSMAEIIERQSGYEVQIRRVTREEKTRVPLFARKSMATVDMQGRVGSVVVPGRVEERDLIHELLHLHRWLVDEKWALVPSHGGNLIFQPQFVMALNNDLEHLSVVEQEISLVGGSRYWEQEYLRAITRWKPTNLFRFDLLRHALFVRKIVPNSIARGLIENALMRHSLVEEANDFIEGLLTLPDDLSRIEFAVTALRVPKLAVQVQRIRAHENTCDVQEVA